MHLRRTLDDENEPFLVIPGKAADRDPESIPHPLDSGFRRNDILMSHI